MLTIINGNALAQSAANIDTAPKPLGEEAFQAVQEFFNYDRSLPLNARTVEVTDKGFYQLEKFVFRNTNDKLVPGYLAIPKLNKANYPCMVLLHAGAGAKDDWWSDEGLIRGLSLSTDLLKSGIAIMALDAEAHGERSIASDFISIRKIWFEDKLTYKLSELWVQSTKDYRQAIDYLLTRKEIDSSRVGLMGYSMGGAMASYLCTHTPQIKLAVMCSVIPFVKSISSSIYPLNFAPRIPNIPILILSGNKDELFSVESIKEFEGLIKSTQKKLVLYDSGHLLPREYLTEAGQWVKARL